MSTRPIEVQAEPSPSLAAVVAAMARVVFQSGMGAAVVDAKWNGIEAAFGAFDPDTVAALALGDIDGLCRDSRVIRNRRKIEAIVDNTRVLLDWDLEDGIRAELDALETDGDREAEVIRRLKFVGPTGAREFLWRIGAVENMECDR